MIRLIYSEQLDWHGFSRLLILTTRDFLNGFGVRGSMYRPSGWPLRTRKTAFLFVSVVTTSMEYGDSCDEEVVLPIRIFGSYWQYAL